MAGTIAAYDKYHEIYDSETVEFWENFPEETIGKFVQKLPGNKVLDLGSGPGRDALLLQNKGLEVTCLDASSEMVKRTSDLGFESVQADMRNMIFADQSFDGVWAYTSLLHITKPEAILVTKKICKIIKPNGVFLIGMIEGKFEGEKEQENMPGEKRYFRFYSEEELKDILEKNGFKFEYQSRYTPHKKTYLSQIYSIK